MKKLLILITLTVLSIGIAGCAAGIPGVKLSNNVKPTHSIKHFTENIAGGAVKQYSFDGKTILIVLTQSHYAGSKNFYRLCKYDDGTYKANIKNDMNGSLRHFVKLVALKNERNIFNKKDNAALPRKIVDSHSIYGYDNIESLFYTKKNYFNECKRNGKILFRIYLKNYLTNTYKYSSGYIDNYEFKAPSSYDYYSSNILAVIY